MINASLLRRPGLAAALDPVHIRRRRALRIAPPASRVAIPAERQTGTDAAPDSTWRDDLRFFLGCYVAGLVFFLIILS